MPPIVLVIGCGIAGPVLAILMKRKGYEPIVFEKVKELGDAGASVMLMPNGLKVLNLVNVAEGLLQAAFPLTEFRDQNFNGTVLGNSHLPASLQARYGQPAAGVKRTDVNLALKRLLIKHNIDLREGWKLEDFKETEDGVVAKFEGDRRVQGSFMIGGDGIKSAAREILLKTHGLREGAPLYTGLTQTSGISSTPPSMRASSSLLNVYGPGAHFITYPISHSYSSWAITLPETTEAQESWRLYDTEEMVKIKAELVPRFRNWSAPVTELINGAERMLKFGLFDREGLASEKWYSTRCVLLGDAAHPTSPHLGQGANQALEDCYHLSTLLPTIDLKTTEVAKSEPSGPELQQVFQTFATKRQARTAKLVEGARVQGQCRVVTGGLAECQRRDEMIRNIWQDAKAVESRYDHLFREPF